MHSCSRRARALLLALSTTATLVACGGLEEEPTPTTITGRVVDGTTQEPLVNVLIVTDPVAAQVFTRTDGVFIIEEGIEVGASYRVTAEKDGYETRTLTVPQVLEGTNTLPAFTLSPSEG